jgi:hypothetical protein
MARPRAEEENGAHSRSGEDQNGDDSASDRRPGKRTGAAIPRKWRGKGQRNERSRKEKCAAPSGSKRMGTDNADALSKQRSRSKVRVRRGEGRGSIGDTREAEPSRRRSGVRPGKGGDGVRPHGRRKDQRLRNQTASLGGLKFASLCHVLEILPIASHVQNSDDSISRTESNSGKVFNGNSQG